MIQLNRIGEELGQLDYVKAMTDVTGFGLLGHLIEMCEASKVSAIIEFDKVPLIDKTILEDYLAKGCIPGGTKRNWASYGHKVGEISDHQKHLLCDPQTSGGLLVAVHTERASAFEKLMSGKGFDLTAFGEITAPGEVLLKIQ